MTSVSILAPAGVTIGANGARYAPLSLMAFDDGIFLIGSTALPGRTGAPIGAAGVRMAGAPTTGAAEPQQLGAAQLSQQLVSQQQSFLRRENRPRRFGFSQQTGSQQLDWQQLVWQQEVAPQQAGAAGAQHEGAQLDWQAGAQHG